MDSKTFSFLKATLGTDGATAMRRAVGRDPRLEYYLIPRTLLGWVMSKSQYEGSLPGVNTVYVSFNKSESGYSGHLGVSTNPVVPFQHSDEFSLVAELATSMGFQTGSFEGTDKMLSMLGKSVDALLKARAATRALAKTGVAAIDKPGQTHQATQPDGPGIAVKPTAVQGAKNPNQPVKLDVEPDTHISDKLGANIPKPKGTLPKPAGTVKPTTVKMGKSELTKKCKTCAGTMFKSEKFVGCMCWRDLAKHSTTTVYGDGVVVEFKKSADPQVVRALYHELNNG